MRNVHIVGCPRSGTTLLMEMMAASFKVDGHCAHEQSIFKVPTSGYDTYLSKKPNDVLWISRILERDPSLYVIAVLRDPRSVICSIHQRSPGLYFCDYPVWKRAEQALAKIVQHPRLVLVRYEELVRDPDGIQERICNALPFLRSIRAGSFSDFHYHAKPNEAASKALGGVRKVDSSRTSGWRAHLPRLKEQVQRYPKLLRDLHRYGYEEDDSWLAELGGVEAKVLPCRYSNRNQWLKRVEQNIRFRWRASRYLATRNKD